MVEVDYMDVERRVAKAITELSDEAQRRMQDLARRMADAVVIRISNGLKNG
jgi:hypothetical protein